MTNNQKNEGFTLVEIIVSIAILIMMAGLGLIIGMDFYRGYSSNYEENLVVGVLQRARSEAMANVDQVKHGACYYNSRYVLFDDTTSCSGGALPASTITFDKGNSASISWPTPVVFNQLDGSCSACSPIPLTVTVGSPGGANVIIKINSEGRIDW